MKKLLLTLLFFSSLAFGQSDWLSPAGMTQVMNGQDDSVTSISLGHSFPYFGGTFTNAWFSTNGFIMLYDPVNEWGNLTTSSLCCNGRDFTNTTSGTFNFMIAPFWTDLKDYNLTNDDGYYYKTNTGVSSFLWYNVCEYGTAAQGSCNLNTFQTNLWPDGSFDFQYDDVSITNHSVTIGFTGNLAFNDYEQMVHQSGYSNNTLLNSTWWDNLVNPGGVEWYGTDGGYSPSVDCTDALTNSACPGYAQAYFDYQCELDGLYDTTCPNYDNALLLQDLSGQDFIFGDNITDFYETEVTQDITEEEFLYTEEEDYGYADSGSSIAYFDQGDDLFSEEQQGPLRDDPVEEQLPGEEIEAIEEEFYADDISDEREIVGGDPSGDLSEEVVVAEEVFEEEILEEVQEQEVNNTESISIALNEISKTEKQLQERVSQIISNSTTFNSTFGSVDDMFGDATISMLSDPTLTTIEINTQSESENDTVDIQMENSVAQVDTGFAAQQDQSFSTGQSITAVLNNVAPNFTQFDVAPPSQQEQQTTAKAESQAGSMSDEQLEQNLEEFTDQMQDSGGFTDQSLTIFLMGRVNGFDQYTGQLQDVSFYVDRGMPGGRVQNDRNSMLRMIGTDDKHARMVAEQYE